MAYDEGLVQRVREILADEPGVVEKKMFGGQSFMVQGNMSCGVLKEDLVVRVGPEQYEAALSRPLAREMDFTGRPMKGMVIVDAEGLDDEEALTDWVQHGLKFALTLPPK